MIAPSKLAPGCGRCWGCRSGMPCPEVERLVCPWCLAHEPERHELAPCDPHEPGRDWARFYATGEWDEGGEA